MIAHLVVEEEVGGNGTLAMTRRGEQADACIVMEPTEHAHPLLGARRGLVPGDLHRQARATAAGRGETVSALKMAIQVIEILEQIPRPAAGGVARHSAVRKYPNPMPITFGKLKAGNWPASAPAQAVLEGVLGLLPNKTRYQVMEEMRQAILEPRRCWLREHFKLEFMYRHDSHVLDPAHPLVGRTCGLLPRSGRGRRDRRDDGLLRLLVLQQPVGNSFGGVRAGQPGRSRTRSEEHIRLDDIDRKRR